MTPSIDDIGDFTTRCVPHRYECAADDYEHTKCGTINIPEVAGGLTLGLVVDGGVLTCARVAGGDVVAETQHAVIRHVAA